MKIRMPVGVQNSFLKIPQTLEIKFFGCNNIHNMYVSVCTNSKYLHFYRDRNLFPYLKYNKDKIYIFAPSGNTSRQVKYEIISDTGVRSNIQRAVREKYKSQFGSLRIFLALKFLREIKFGH